MPSFGKRTPFTEQHLKPFEDVYGDDPKGTSPRQEGEYSFDALSVELANDDANRNVDKELPIVVGVVLAVNGLLRIRVIH
jgi:type I restriction enzyme M protein